MKHSILHNIGFHPLISSWFTKYFSEPSPPQREGWPSIAQGRHTLIMAPTGSGKTLSAFLWSIDELFRMSQDQQAEHFESNRDGIHTLYISPLKALNNDIERNLRFPLKSIAGLAEEQGLKPAPVRAAVRTGDTPPHIRQSMLKRPPHILITTPESLYLLLTSERGRMLFGNLRYIIVDEIHAVSGNKRGVHLSLSLERLSRLTGQTPVRIGLSATQRPLKTIAAFLGGQEYLPEQKTWKQRPVEIVDCGQRKNMDLKVISPVPSFSDLPESSVWPAVYNLLYRMIRDHRTTLIFAGMRAQTEKIARKLNERHQQETGDPEAVIALAHHGSISRETRYAVEARLKEGRIPAVVATASLELGIDIGSIDLVIQLESPKSVAAGLQRVGRSGHLMKATSKGRIIPLYQADLDDVAALVRAMKAGEIEETRIPEAPLDVLSQQILAEVSMQNQDFDKLYNLCRQSYCYRNLSLNVYRQVIEMLAGTYAESPLRALRPRLNWDKVNQKLIALPGSRQTALLNAGTIPDRAYYGVFLQDSNTNLGEVEEEFVFESRIGDIFFLGNNEWRIEDIRQDRIIVSPVADIKPRAPFWKGDVLYRDYATSRRIAAFRETLVEKIAFGTAEDWLSKDSLLDDTIIDNLIGFYKRQLAHSGHIAGKTQLVLEWFTDSAGEPLMLLHAPFGAKVNAPWAIAIAATIEQTYGSEVQYAYDDDAILIRLLDTEERLPLETVVKLDPVKAGELIVSALEHTQIFAIHFRYNAARALLLGRSRPGKRIPLWLQRLRAADLAQQVQTYPDFPVIVETYRECLFDLFDLPALKEVLSDIRNGHILVRSVDLPAPSPMTSGILFKFLAENLYDLDRSRQPSESGGSKSSLLDEIMQQERIPRMIDQSVVQELEERWQHLSPAFQARDQETLFNIILELGPLTTEELEKRSRQDPQPWLASLENSGRIRHIDQPKQGWVTPETEARLESTGDNITTGLLIELLLRTTGPLSLSEITERLPAEEEQVAQVIDQRVQDKRIIKGLLLKDREEQLYSDPENFRQLYRRAVSARRSRSTAAENRMLIPFMLNWHQLDHPGLNLERLIRQYSGFAFPPGFFENEILYNRLCCRDSYELGGKLSKLEDLIREGRIIVQVMEKAAAGQRPFRFFPRGQGALFIDPGGQSETLESVSEDSGRVFNFLKENGASMSGDLEEGLEMSSRRLKDALRELVLGGLVTSDHFSNLQYLLSPESRSQESGQQNESAIPGAPPWSRPRKQPRRLRRSDFERRAGEFSRFSSGRWFLTQSFAVTGKKRSRDQKSEQQARLLLQRYGILVKEWYRHENGLLPWYELFQVLKRLEWRGEVERGYFISGLSGIQFALPEAVHMLNRMCREGMREHAPLWISTTDPALPLGGTVGWNTVEAIGPDAEITRLPVNHLLIHNWQPLVYSENYGKRITMLKQFNDDHAELLAGLIKIWLKRPPEMLQRKRIGIERIDGQAATAHPLAGTFLKMGYESDGEKLILWPSGV